MTPLDQRVRELCQQSGVSSLYVFGSRAREIAARLRGTEGPDALPDSDVDVAVVPSAGRRMTAREKVTLAAELEDALSVGRVDLVVLTEASPFLAADIVAGELLYDADPHATAELELYVLRRAGDLLPFERARRELVLRGGGR